MSSGYTVFGASGLIGSALVAALHAAGKHVRAVGRGEPPPNGPWGRAIYAVGITADFRTRPAELVEAHAGYAAALLMRGDVATFTYISSTRMYRDGATGEENPISIDPADSDRTYDASKLLGESLTRLIAGPAARIVRLSNVVPLAPEGPTFLADVVREARANGVVTIRESPESARDYISLDDAIEGILRVARCEGPACCNVASGVNVGNARIADLLSHHLGAHVRFEEGARPRRATPIRIDALRERIGFTPSDPVPAIVAMMKG